MTEYRVESRHGQSDLHHLQASHVSSQHEPRKNIQGGNNNDRHQVVGCDVIWGSTLEGAQRQLLRISVQMCALRCPLHVHLQTETAGVISLSELLQSLPPCMRSGTYMNYKEIISITCAEGDKANMDAVER